MLQPALFSVLKTIGLPLSYYQWKAPPALPYLVYKSSDNDNIKSDFKVHATWNYYDIEHYYTSKNLNNEKTITDILETIDIDYTKTEEIYITTEQMYMKTYTIKTLNWR